MKKEKERFEDHLAQVEASIKALEGGTLGLEESLAKYEEGIKALRKCYEILEGAEKRIQVLLKDEAGELKPQPYDPAEASPVRGKAEPASPAKDNDELPF